MEYVFGFDEKINYDKNKLMFTVGYFEEDGVIYNNPIISGHHMIGDNVVNIGVHGTDIELEGMKKHLINDGLDEQQVNEMTTKEIVTSYNGFRKIEFERYMKFDKKIGADMERAGYSNNYLEDENNRLKEFTEDEKKVYKTSLVNKTIERKTQLKKDNNYFSKIKNNLKSFFKFKG